METTLQAPAFRIKKNFCKCNDNNIARIFIKSRNRFDSFKSNMKYDIGQYTSTPIHKNNIIVLQKINLIRQ